MWAQKPTPLCSGRWRLSFRSASVLLLCSLSRFAVLTCKCRHHYEAQCRESDFVYDDEPWLAHPRVLGEAESPQRRGRAHDHHRKHLALLHAHFAHARQDVAAETDIRIVIHGDRGAEGAQRSTQWRRGSAAVGSQWCSVSAVRIALSVSLRVWSAVCCRCLLRSAVLWCGWPTVLERRCHPLFRLVHARCSHTISKQQQTPADTTHSQESTTTSWRSRASDGTAVVSQSASTLKKEGRLPLSLRASLWSE